MTQSLTVKPGEGCQVSAITDIKGNGKRLNVLVELLQECGYGPELEVVPVYSTCRAGSSKVWVMLFNHTEQAINLTKGCCVGTLTAANFIPNKIAPRYADETPAYAEETREKGQAYAGTRAAHVMENPINRKKLLLEKLNLEGCHTWTEDKKGRAKDLFEEYNDIFALGTMELGKTSLVKHAIKLNNHQPFKERYRRIPPHQFEEVRKHLQEMEDIGAIRRSNSLWASPVVLVRKKDGSLRFCIDLRKLNSQTVKDAYSLPHIEESLDCLNGWKIFTSLD